MEIKRIPTDGMAANSYLLVSGKEAAIVDPSAPVKEIEKLLEGARVRYILLTHCHFDHVLTLDETRQAFLSPLLVHEDEADALSDPRRSLFRTFFGFEKKFAPAERLLKDGDELPLGGESIRVISTPGHTPGSVCYLADSFIVTGDTLFAESIGRSDFPGGDRDSLFRSLERLKKLDGSLVIYPGHDESDTLENVLKNNPYMNGEL